ncbi:MAG: 30S ribosome-binding factor RbfA [Hornefia sp.]|nr:30S ribosome-binding factor RbfA [Hornefia sp.]
MGKGYRQGRLGEEIRKIISRMLLRDLKDPRFDGRMISVSAVDVTRDNSYATCYITVLDMAGNEEKADMQKNEIIDGFNNARGMIRKEIGSKIKLRHVPELIFKIDESLEYGRRIDEVIRSLGKEDEQ